jgi:hypothetical protein
LVFMFVPPDKFKGRSFCSFDGVDVRPFGEQSRKEIN